MEKSENYKKPTATNPTTKKAKNQAPCKTPKKKNLIGDKVITTFKCINLKHEKKKKKNTYIWYMKY